MLMIQAICVLRVADLLSWESSPYDYGTARLWHNLRVVCLVASLVYMLMMGFGRVWFA